MNNLCTKCNSAISYFPNSDTMICLKCGQTFDKLPQTNGDYIRSMSDEELAAERIEFSYNPNGPDEYIGDFGSVPVKYIAGKEQPESRQEALRCELDWLRQPKETP